MKGRVKKGAGLCRPLPRCEHRNARGEVRCISNLILNYVIPVRECELFTVIHLGHGVDKFAVEGRISIDIV